MEEKQREQIKSKNLLLCSSSPKVYQLVQTDYCKDLSRKKYCFSEYLIYSINYLAIVLYFKCFLKYHWNFIFRCPHAFWSLFSSSELESTSCRKQVWEEGEPNKIQGGDEKSLKTSMRSCWKTREEKATSTSAREKKVKSVFCADTQAEDLPLNDVTLFHS